MKGLRRASTETEDWASSTSQSNIGNHSLSWNKKKNKKKEIPAASNHTACYGWAVWQQRLKQTVQARLNVSSRSVMGGGGVRGRTAALKGSLQNTAENGGFFLSDCPPAWKQRCGCRWRRPAWGACGGGGGWGSNWGGLKRFRVCLE